MCGFAHSASVFMGVDVGSDRTTIFWPNGTHTTIGGLFIDDGELENQ